MEDNIFQDDEPYIPRAPLVPIQPPPRYRYPIPQAPPVPPQQARVEPKPKTKDIGEFRAFQFANRDKGERTYKKLIADKYYNKVEKYLEDNPQFKKSIGVDKINKNFWNLDNRTINKIVGKVINSQTQGIIKKRTTEKGRQIVSKTNLLLAREALRRQRLEEERKQLEEEEAKKNKSLLLSLRQKAVARRKRANLRFKKFTNEDFEDESGRYDENPTIRSGRFSTDYLYIWRSRTTEPTFEEYAGSVVDILSGFRDLRVQFTFYYITKDGASVPMSAPVSKNQKRKAELVKEEGNRNDPEFVMKFLTDMLTKIGEKDASILTDPITGEPILTESFFSGIGSEVSQDDVLRIDLTRFSITVFKPVDVKADTLIIPDVKHKNKKTSTKFTPICEDYPANDPRQSRFIIEDFNSEGGNCLLEVFRNVCDNKKLSSMQLRKEVLKVGIYTPLTVEHIPALEAYFGKTCAVIYKSECKLKSKKNGSRISYELDNINKFETEVDFIDYFAYKTVEKPDFLIWMSNVNVLANQPNDNHVSLIKDRFEGTRCPISGLPIEKRKKQATQQAIIDELIRTRRLDEKKIEINYGKEEKVGATEKKKLYWGYDFETVYNEFGDLIPYSVCCVVGSIDGTRFSEIDRFSSLGFDSGKEFAYWLMDKSRTLRKTDKETVYDNILVGYNSSRFDNFILIGELARMGLLNKNSVMVAGNSILELKFLSFRSIDLCRFLMCPLKKACDGFKCVLQKSKLEHAEIQKLYFTNPSGFIQTIKDDNEKRTEILDYNMLDCTSMMELYSKFRDAINIIMQLDIDDFLTSSQIAYESFKNTVNKDCKVKTVETRERWDFIRKAVVAGRSQMFQKGHFEGEFQSWDVKSLYPYAMLAGEYPIGEEKETDCEVPNKLGIYRCKISNQPTPKIIPRRMKGEPLNWETEEEFEANITSVDIKTLREHGAIVQVFNGLYWENSSNEVFRNYIKPLKDIKTRQDELKSIKPTPADYNPALRETVKLLLNSLSGKVIQRIFNSESSFITDTSDYQTFMQKHENITMSSITGTGAIFVKGELIDKKYNIKSVKPNQLGVFIYSYSRRHMYNAVLSKTKPFATDTDSCHVMLSEFDQLPISNNHWESRELPPIGTFYKGDEFGNFEGELEKPTRDAYYIAPKCYGLFFKDGGAKMKFKGIGYRDKLIDADLLNKDDFDMLTIQEKGELYEKLEPALCEDLFKAMASGKKVSIICSQLSKKIISNDKTGASVFKLSQVYNYKTISAPAIPLNYYGEVQYEEEL